MANFLPSPRFGLDAPGVVRNLFLVTAGCVVAWLLRLSVRFVLWSDAPEADQFSINFPLMYMGLGLGFACALSGVLMVWYSYDGKIRMREGLLNLVPWRGDEQVLDVGCGRGLMLTGAAGRLKTGKATGIDLWQGEDLSGNSPQATLAVARAAGVADRVDVKTGDARELPFANTTFDVVLSSTALHNIYDPAGRERAIREIARVLKPGGRVVLADIRHTRQYTAVLSSCGLADVQHRSSWLAVGALLLTFGSVRPATVTARKNP